MPSKYFDRYIRGEYEEVWSDLLTLGDSIQEEPLLNDAIAVTQETMKRVKYNIELLAKRLLLKGYLFGTFTGGQQKVHGYDRPINFPKQDVKRQIAKLESLEGINKIPLSLKIFWEVVGDVDFTGFHPLLTKFSDPLVVYSFESVMYEYNLWRENLDNRDVEINNFGILISPDFYHKSNVSGGKPYKIQVQNGAIDAILENERHNTTFVNYLRITFRQGGFSNIHWIPEFTPQEFLNLNNDLMPI
jgi:hypothetical protein